MTRNSFHSYLSFPICIREGSRDLALGLMLWSMMVWTNSSQAILLWSDLGATQVHETGIGSDILGTSLRRDDTSSDALYFKFHVDPVSDANTELYFAAFQLFEGNHERLAVGNALNAWAYSAFATGQIEPSNQAVEYIDLNSANPQPSGIGTFHSYELPHSRVERTIVFKVQYIAGGDDLVTVWMDPDLRTSATQTNQPNTLTTQFKANASFDQIHLRHGGGGDGWIFSEMAVATSFNDFTDPNRSGANGESPFTFRSWQREQGLPENHVRAVAQTRDGYIWVGTGEGVNRFDGVNFFSLGAQEEFQGGAVEVLFGDSRGALWIGTARSGLSCWQNGKLRNFTRKDGLPSDAITALAEDGQRRLWVGTRGGLAIWQDGQLITLNGADIFSNHPITTLYWDHKSTMWVGAAGTGIFSFQGDKFTQLRDPVLDSLLQEPHCVLVDRQGRIWIGAADEFVLCRDGDQWRRFSIPRRFATRHISALAEEPDGTVWAGSLGEGLFEFKDGKLVVANASSGLSDNRVEALLVDQEGKLWVGTRGGLNRIYPKRVSVLSRNQGLDYGIVQAVVEIKPGVMWAAQPDGVYQWDGQIFRRLALGGLSSQQPSVRALLKTRGGSCWVAGERGLLRFRNPLTAEGDNSAPVLVNLSITALGEDANGSVWAGTQDGQLWHLANDHWQQETNFPHEQSISAIVPDADGGLWVGTQGDGLYRLDNAARGNCTKIRGLPSDSIRALFLDAQRTLWIGTAGAGLSRLQDGRIETFTTREGLPDNTISQILGDDCLWLGGNRGIVRVKKRELDDLVAHRTAAIYPRVFGRTDGMLSEECTSGFFPAGLKSSDGLLWFPTLKGIVVVNPRDTVSSPAPAVVLEHVLVDGAPEISAPSRTNNGAHFEPEDNTLTETLELEPGKHTLEFRYTGINFDAPERVRFRYRLAGLDTDWTEAGLRRTAFYGYVPPGNYRFEVIACNDDGIWNKQGDRLVLIVLPHFWQTWWFISAAAMGTIVVGAGVARFVEKRKSQHRLKRLEQERLLEQERTRIAQDLHDTMGAKLCRISFLSEHARRNDAVSPEVREQISSISNDSREVLQSLDEIVWAVNPQNDTLEHLVSYIGQYAREYFRRTGIECEVEIPSKLPEQPLSAQSRHHLFLSVDESLTNILKHSGATRVRIAMAFRGDEFEIAVTDNGVGIDPNSERLNGSISQSGFGNGLRNMQQRVAKLGGRCSVESEKGRGTTIRFVLSFPDSM